MKLPQTSSLGTLYWYSRGEDERIRNGPAEVIDGKLFFYRYGIAEEMNPDELTGCLTELEPPANAPAFYVEPGEGEA